MGLLKEQTWVSGVLWSLSDNPREPSLHLAEIQIEYDAANNIETFLHSKFPFLAGLETFTQLNAVAPVMDKVTLYDYIIGIIIGIDNDKWKTMII